MESIKKTILKITNYNESFIRNFIAGNNDGDVFDIIDNIIPPKKINKNIVVYALRNGYKINENTPKCIKNNLKYAFFCLKSNIQSDVIDYIDSDLISDELIMLTFNSNNYIITDKTPEIIRNNTALIKNWFYLKRNKTQDDIASFINYMNQDLITRYDVNNILNSDCFTGFVSLTNFKIHSKSLLIMLLSDRKHTHLFDKLFEKCDPNLLTFDVLTVAANSGYSLSSNTPFLIRNNDKFLIYMLKEKNAYAYTIDYTNLQQYSEELLNVLLEKKYSFFKSTPAAIYNNYEFFKKTIENVTNYSRLIDDIYYGNSEFLNDEIIDLAISKGYISEYEKNRVPNKILETYRYIYKIIEKNGCTALVNHINPKLIDDKLIDLLIIKNYAITEDTPYIIKKNYDVVYKFVCKEKDLSGTSSLNWCDPSIVDDKLVCCAIENGFYIENSYKGTSKTINDIVLNNKKYIYLMLEYAINNSKKNNIVCILRMINAEVLNLDIVNKLIKKYPELLIGYFILKENVAYTSSLFESNYKKSNNKYKEYILDYFGAPVAYILVDNMLLTDDVINCIGMKNVIRLLKYIVLPGSEFNIENIISSGYFNDLVYSYIKITKDDINELNISVFVKYANNYMRNKKYIDEVVATNTVNRYKGKILRLIENRYDDIIFSTLDDLDKEIYANNIEILNSENIIDIKNSIFKLLVNRSYDDIFLLLSEIINSEKIKNIQNSINDDELYNVLKYYDILVSFLNEILTNHNIMELKEILKILNEKYINNPDAFDIMVKNFNDILTNSKLIYAYEALGNLTKLSDRKSTDTFKIKEKAYKVDKKIAKKEKIANMYVDYIEISEEAYFFQHVMNGFVTSGVGRGTLKDYKNPRVIGLTYICLTAISNLRDKNFLLRTKITDINNVVLLFNNVTPTSLVHASNSDLGSTAELNDLNVRHHSDNFNTILNTLLNSFYSEYVVYRENNKGEFIYPCGVLVTGEKPCEYEIAAAAYLNVPLVKLIYAKKRVIPSQVEHKKILESDPKKVEVVLNDIVESVKRR